MSVLASVKELALEFKLPEPEVASRLKAAKIRLHRMKVGDDNVELYEVARARTIIKLYIRQEEKSRKEAAAKLVTNAMPIAISTDNTEVLAAIKKMYTDMAIVTEIATSVQKLLDQNMLLFRELKESRDECRKSSDTLNSNISDRLSALEGAWNKVLSAASSGGSPVTVNAPPGSTSKRLPRVGVVGLFAMHHTAMQKEFDGLLDLRLLTPDEGKKIVGLKNVDHIFVLVKHISHIAADRVHALNVPFSNVPGSTSELRSALTEYSVNPPKEV